MTSEEKAVTFTAGEIEEISVGIAAVMHKHVLRLCDTLQERGPSTEYIRALQNFANMEELYKHTIPQFVQEIAADKLERGIR